MEIPLRHNGHTENVAENHSFENTSISWKLAGTHYEIYKQKNRVGARIVETIILARCWRQPTAAQLTPLMSRLYNTSLWTRYAANLAQCGKSIRANKCAQRR